MEKKAFAFLGIFAVLLMSLGFTSAATTLNDVSINFNQTTLDDVVTGEEYSIEITIENNNATDYNITLSNNYWDFSPASIDVSGNTNGSFVGTYTIRDVGSTTVTATIYDISDPNTNFTIARTLTTNHASTSNTTNDTNTSTTEYFCELDNFGTETGHLEISEVEVTNNGAGDDEEWEYLDEIVIEVTVENTDDENINDVMVEIMIKDSDGNTVTKKDLDLSDDEEDLGRINDDDEETATFKIDELPIDLEEGDYKLYVRAYEDGNEDNECVSESEDFTNTDETYFEFEIKSSEDSTVIVKREIPNVKASCGDKNAEVRFMVYNTGSDDEDTVLVTLESSRLGIYEKTVIDNLRDGKGKEVVFYITIPEEVEKTYEKLEIYTYYDYDDDEDEDDEDAYGESSEDEGDDFSMLLEIISCQATEPTVTANLESKTELGEDLVIKAKIKNEGSDNNFIISASGYEAWANLVSINPQTASIDAGEYQEVIITLSPTQAGAQSFTIDTVVDGITNKQTVSVNIADSGLFGLTNNLVAYTIIGIVALLVLIFLVLILRISKGKTAAQF